MATIDGPLYSSDTKWSISINFYSEMLSHQIAWNRKPIDDAQQVDGWVKSILRELHDREPIVSTWFSEEAGLMCRRMYFPRPYFTNFVFRKQQEIFHDSIKRDEVLDFDTEKLTMYQYTKNSITGLIELNVQDFTFVQRSLVSLSTGSRSVYGS